MVHLFTSAASNYMGKVRTLLYSVRHHHPEWRLHLFLGDRVAPVPPARNGSGEPWDEIHLIDSLPLGRDERWLFSHSVVELCTAIKGMAAQTLLEREDVETVIYLDPDIVVFDRLDDLVARIERASIAFTPHITEPEATPDAVLDNEVSSLRFGTFNLGFLGLRKSDETSRFLAWWSDRLEHYCWAEPEKGLFTDQKWIDLAPSFFEELTIVRDPRFNVAPWNLSQRTVSGSFDEGFRVNGRPLGFYHFTGFDGGDHEAMVGKYGRNNAALAMLIAWYKLRTAQLASTGTNIWQLGFYSNGEPIDTAHRVIYRRRIDLQRAFPDPYLAERDHGYLNWVRHQGPIEYPDLLS